MKLNQKIAIGVGSVAVFAGIGMGVANSVVAPGVYVNGADIGLSTQSSAADKLHQHLDNSVVNVNGQQFTYDELGVTYDEEKLNEIFKNNKALSFDSWNTAVSQPITIDAEKMQEAVSKKLPDTYKDPVDADVQLNENKDAWVVVPGANGTMPVVEELRKTIEQDLTAENKTDEVKSYDLTQQKIEPSITDSIAEDFASKINTMADEAGFYEGDDKKVDISNSNFAEMVTVEKAEKGFTISPIEDRIRNYAETIPEKVNKEVDNGSAVVDETGKVLRTLDEFNDGYKFDDVDGLVSRSVEQLSNGESAKFALNGSITKAKVDEKFRRIEVDLTARETRTYENDKLVKTYPVAIGKPGTPTDKGQFKVFHQTQKMDMGCTPRYDYCTKDVPFATFYNGGEGFHGTWWHSDFGNKNGSMRSHGCVNMRTSDAEEIYYFAQTGTPVHVF